MRVCMIKEMMIECGGVEAWRGKWRYHGELFHKRRTILVVLAM